MKSRCLEGDLLCARIVGEYLEMPGLTLTLAQAQRLWGAEVTMCARALDRLVSSGFLRRSGKTYMRADVGRIAA